VYISTFGSRKRSPHLNIVSSCTSWDARAGAKRVDGYADGSGNIGHSIFDIDGKNIYFAFSPAGQNGAPRIMRYAIGSRRLTIPTGMPDQSYDPALSPDGQTIYFALRTATGTDIFRLPVNGGTPTQLTKLNTARAPAISPDGAWLVYLAVPAGSSGI
jgi:TolB protein